MSIEIYAFLGDQLDDLEARLFEDVGFGITLHPETRILEPNAHAALYLRLDAAPHDLNRIAPDTPLLLSFGYGVAQATLNKHRNPQWPPPGVKSHTHEIVTRTSNGRSPADAIAQSLTAAVLAKITVGYYYVLGERQAIPGGAALEQVIQELQYLSRLEFDNGAFPFTDWPVIFTRAVNAWNNPIALTHKHPPPPKRRWRLPSILELFGYALMAVFVALTFLYG